jgi:hypothetical protein
MAGHLSVMKTAVKYGLESLPVNEVIKHKEFNAVYMGFLGEIAAVKLFYPSFNWFPVNMLKNFKGSNVNDEGDLTVGNVNIDVKIRNKGHFCSLLINEDGFKKQKDKVDIFILMHMEKINDNLVKFEYKGSYPTDLVDKVPVKFINKGRKIEILPKNLLEFQESFEIERLTRENLELY